MSHRPTQTRTDFLRTDCTTLWIMATVAVCCGFAVNQFRGNPLPLIYASKAERIRQAVERIAVQSESSDRINRMDRIEAEVSASETQAAQGRAALPIDLETFREMQKTALVLDARPEIFHRLGRVPKAISLPRDDFEAYYTKQRTLLEKYKAHPIAIYCSGGSCEDGEMVGSALIRLGFTDVYLFRGGWHEWTRAKLPEESSL